MGLPQTDSQTAEGFCFGSLLVLRMDEKLARIPF
jgi:hypothetical protein